MKISIIICTRNRHNAIGPCLASAAAALSAVQPIAAELLVVDNGSTDDTASRVKIWAAAQSFSVKLLSEPRKGVANARNCGLRYARGELLAFTDDDCCYSANYFAEFLALFQSDTRPVLRGGRVELGDPLDLPITIQTCPDTKRWDRLLNSARHSPLGGGAMLGCNFGMHRAVFERVGFFDENLGPGSSIPAAEDTDYIFRAYLASFMIEYVPCMTVFHNHGRRQKKEIQALIRNYVLGAGALYAKFGFRHPELHRKANSIVRKFRLVYEGGDDETLASAAPGALTQADLSKIEKIKYGLLGAALYFLRSFVRSSGPAI